MGRRPNSAWDTFLHVLVSEEMLLVELLWDSDVIAGFCLFTLLIATEHNIVLKMPRAMLRNNQSSVVQIHYRSLKE
jgi:hypothetical protein